MPRPVLYLLWVLPFAAAVTVACYRAISAGRGSTHGPRPAADIIPNDVLRRLLERKW